MYAQHGLLFDVEMRGCLAAITEVAAADDLEPAEIALRLAQYADGARGDACPEATFDPVYLALRRVASRLQAAPEGARERWLRCVDEAVARERGRTRAAARQDQPAAG
jgi:hypothetical protein